MADRYRGRIFGAYNTTNTVLLLVGMGLSSALGGLFGARSMVSAMELLYFLGGVTGLLLLRNAQALFAYKQDQPATKHPKTVS